MALTAPASIVVWQTGSTYVHKNIAATPATANRTYANFELDETTGTSCTGSSPFTIDNLIITTGSWGLGIKSTFTINGSLSIANGATLNLNPTIAGTIALKGDVNIASGGTLNVNPTVTEEITFSGTGAQAVNNAGTFNSTSGASYVVANTVGVNIASNVAILTLTINTGAVLNVNAGKQLTVSTTLANSGTLNLLSDASGTATILTPETLGGTGGTYTVSQYLTAGRNWYVSSPVSAAKSDVFSASLAHPLLSYDETHGTSAPWTYISNTTTDLTAMKGYVANIASTGVVTFSGSLNNGAQTIAVSRTAGQTKEGFNLVGNPYPSYLDWTNVTKTNLSTTMWYRTKSASTFDTGTSGFVFDTYNATGGVGTSLGAKAVTNLIPPMQAFWVLVNAGQTSGTFAATNSQRAHADNSSNGFKSKSSTAPQPLLRLEVSNGTISDQALVYFNANASNGLDSYDSPKMSSNETASTPEIYSLAGTEKVAINGVNNMTQLTLGFTTGEANNFIIKASQFNNFVSGTQIILRDNLMNVEQDLTVADYNFYSDITANNETRFTVLFKAPSVATGINSNSIGNSWISVNANNQIVLNGVTGETTVAVYNEVGQRIVSQRLTSTAKALNTQLATGIYMVKVTNVGKTATTKVIIK